MSQRPTFLQTLFNQPSQKYAAAASSSSSSAASSSSSASAAAAADDGAYGTIAYASEKLAALVSPHNVTSRLGHSPLPVSDPDSADDMFFTPLTSPAHTPEHPRSPARPISASSVTSDDVDDLFSSRSATTSVSSFSVSSKPDPADHGHRSRSLFRRPRSTTVPAWSRGVRWLVPPENIRHSSQPAAPAIFHNLDLVDVDYQPTNKGKSHKSRKSARSISDRMSAVLEEEEGDDEHIPPAQSGLPRSRTAPSMLSPRRGRAPSTFSRTAAYAPRTVSIPSPLPVTAGTTSPTGYTSLTLPRAAYTPAKHRISSTVDITLSGLAQTTMATISITTRPRPSTPAHLRAHLPSPLAFTSHTPPPGKVHARDILVQVWAVALDALDAQIVNDRAARNDGLGFVPGRSFVGRAIETGWEVSNIHRGDWVVGLTDMRKCGALAEFIVVDRRRVHPAPAPALSAPLTLEQLAALPLAGVPAHRAVRTLAYLPHTARTLVLAAHTGPGLLVAQELVAQGRHVIAHVPPGASAPPGAREVRPGHPAAIIEGLPPATLDAVLDPLGGRTVWAAARTALRPAGQFTTLVGDGGVRGAAHFRSTMRAMFGAGRVGYHWVSPVADVDAEGADVRDSLEAVVQLAVDGVLRPHVGCILPLDRAPEAFAAADQAPVVRIVE